MAPLPDNRSSANQQLSIGCAPRGSERQVAHVLVDWIRLDIKQHLFLPQVIGYIIMPAGSLCQLTRYHATGEAPGYWPLNVIHICLCFCFAILAVGLHVNLPPPPSRCGRRSGFNGQPPNSSGFPQLPRELEIGRNKPMFGEAKG